MDKPESSLKWMLKSANIFQSTFVEESTKLRKKRKMMIACIADVRFNGSETFTNVLVSSNWGYREKSVLISGKLFRLLYRRKKLVMTQISDSSCIKLKWFFFRQKKLQRNNRFTFHGVGINKSTSVTIIPPFPDFYAEMIGNEFRKHKKRCRCK